jgi:hypothetical protein
MCAISYIALALFDFSPFCVSFFFAFVWSEKGLSSWHIVGCNLRSDSVLERRYDGND